MTIIKCIVVLMALTVQAQAQSLQGSASSVNRQYHAALDYGYTFVKSAHSVKQMVDPGYLVRVNPDRYLELHDVSFPYVRPGAKMFLSRISEQYSNACGEKLTVTSLLRPKDRQPANASARSVHPAGMAIDLRIPAKQKCRSWLENTLLSLEKDRVVDVTRERYPPHYHVAVFVKDYETRVAQLSGSEQKIAYSGSSQRYVVRRGDTLSEIADRTDVDIAQLRAANGLRGNLIYFGQKLHIPTTEALASNVGSGQEAADNSITHRVNRGDTLWRIANRYGTSVDELRQANDVNNSLQIGQVLRISKG